MTWPKITPPTVLKTNATSPRQIILIVAAVRKVAAFMVAPTEMPRKMVVALRISFCAARLSRSVQPHSRSRLPNISMPTSGTAGGRISPQAMEATIGNRILSTRPTGRSWSILMPRSALEVSSLMTGGWMSGTSDM